MYVVLDPAVEKRIIYIPVAEATDGGTPILSNRGLKIAPPPRPRAPLTQPPTNAKITNFKSKSLWNLMSLGAIPYPTLILRAYSLSTDRVLIQVMTQHNTKKAISMSQSAGEHLSMPITDSTFRLPLNKFTTTNPMRHTTHNPCLSHCLCVFSTSI